MELINGSMQQDQRRQCDVKQWSTHMCSAARSMASVRDEYSPCTPLITAPSVLTTGFSVEYSRGKCGQQPIAELHIANTEGS